MPRTHPHLLIDAGPLTLTDLESVARGSRRVELGTIARQKLAAARAIVESALSDGQAHYGLNTGFGSLSRVRIEQSELRTLQLNLVRSHAAGVGAPLPSDVVRGMLLLLAASLARGHSGVRPQVVEALLALLNAGVTPVVPSVGSVGASGDLAPLAHVALTLVGEGEATLANASPGDAPAARLPAREALHRAGLAPLTLEAKEGLALINGTHLMASQGGLTLVDAQRLFDAALLAAAMAMDAAMTTDAFLDPRVHAVRPQAGQAHVARALREYLRGSQILTSHRENDPRVQDPYSFRCVPQVLGAAWDALGYVKHAFDAELASVTDNPLVFASAPGHGSGVDGVGAVVSAGNFHGMPLALPLDALAIALAHVAGISERRTFWMLSAFDKESGLPPYLAARGAGLSSGLMIAQYTAAACCNELIGLANPASVANISTSAGIEDYNSFGPRSASKAARAVELARFVVAIELLCAAEGLEYHRPLRSGDAVERAHALIRALVPKLTGDRSPTADIEALCGAVATGAIAEVF